MWEIGPSEKELENLRNTYPVGTRIELERMGDDYDPILPGMRGTVLSVDDLGSVQAVWDNGRFLALLPECDKFRKLTSDEVLKENLTKDIGEEQYEQR
ncbi:MAG: DUF4314 domain-containing protein [Clostridia bacterium]|nr:DUF4314 domain-containing protein [Clostridia bacterium]